MRLLELFSGAGSMGRAFRDLGWEVISLDITPGRQTIRADIPSWDYSTVPTGYVDAIHASPLARNIQSLGPVQRNREI